MVQQGGQPGQGRGRRLRLAAAVAPVQVGAAAAAQPATRRIAQYLYRQIQHQLLTNQLVQVQNRLSGLKMYHSCQRIVKFGLFLGRQAGVKHLGQREALLDERLGRQARGLQAPVARQLDGRSDGAVDQEQIAAVDEGQAPARRLGALEVRLL